MYYKTIFATLAITLIELFNVMLHISTYALTITIGEAYFLVDIFGLPYAGPLTEANHLGNVAYRVGKKIHWDAKEMRATNAPDAEQFIRRDYRRGWNLS